MTSGPKIAGATSPSASAATPAAGWSRTMEAAAPTGWPCLNFRRPSDSRRQEQPLSVAQTDSRQAGACTETPGDVTRPANLTRGSGNDVSDQLRVP